MEIEITLHGGPLEVMGIKAMTVETLDEVRLFVDPVTRIVLAYRRFEDSLGYVFDGKASLGLTENYDEVSRRLGPKIKMYELRRNKDGDDHAQNATPPSPDRLPENGALP